MSAPMILHAGRRIERPGVIRTTTLCGRMNARSKDGMNIADDGQAVTCKFCIAKAARLAKAQYAPTQPAKPNKEERMAKAKLTPRQREVLSHLAAGRPADFGCSGRAEYGGLTSTLMSLVRAGYINNMHDQGISEAGRDAIKESDHG